MYYLSIVCARKSISSPIRTSCPMKPRSTRWSRRRRRGVDVRIMVSGIHNDNWLARRNSVRLYGPLLEAGIEILEFNRTMLHQKTMVVDARWATVGTTNFDNRSFAHNEENNVCVYDAAWARRAARHLPRPTSPAAIASRSRHGASRGIVAGGDRRYLRRSSRTRFEGERRRGRRPTPALMTSAQAVRLVARRYTNSSSTAPSSDMTKPAGSACV